MGLLILPDSRIGIPTRLNFNLFKFASESTYHIPQLFYAPALLGTC